MIWKKKLHWSVTFNWVRYPLSRPSGGWSRVLRLWTQLKVTDQWSRRSERSDASVIPKAPERTLFQPRIQPCEYIVLNVLNIYYPQLVSTQTLSEGKSLFLTLDAPLDFLRTKASEFVRSSSWWKCRKQPRSEREGRLSSAVENLRCSTVHMCGSPKLNSRQSSDHWRGLLSSTFHRGEPERNHALVSEQACVVVPHPETVLPPGVGPAHRYQWVSKVGPGYSADVPATSLGESARKNSSLMPDNSHGRL